TQRLPDRLRGPPDPEQQLTTQQPRSAVKLTHLEADSDQREIWLCSLSVTALLTGFSSNGQVKDIADVRGK
ncbi:hypothetical protein, partial [Streptomyces mirabilis]|uniref:hypothetical protein n=1 Tax=Streptomyces mirabilis TaxID=68239 RepID=UPI00367A9C94